MKTAEEYIAKAKKVFNFQQIIVGIIGAILAIIMVVAVLTPITFDTTDSLNSSYTLSTTQQTLNDLLPTMALLGGFVLLTGLMVIQYVNR